MAKAKEPGDPVRVDAREERARRRLVQFAEEIGYTPTQVADMAGIPQANVARYMKGESAIPLDALGPLALVFGRPESDFLAPEAGPRPDPSKLAPILMKARPGVTLSQEDLEDYEAMLARMQARRAAKLGTKAKGK